MKKVLFVLETSGASGQDNNRALVYRHAFEKDGVQVRYLGWQPQHPLWLVYPKTRLAVRLGNSFEYNLYAQAKFAILRRWNRFRILREARNADVIVLIKISSLELIKAIRRVSKARLVYDLGDALWLPTYANSYSQIDHMLATVDAVTSDNPSAIDYAKRFSQHVHPWDSYPQIEAFDKHRRPKPSSLGKPLVIGWLGSPGTLYNLYSIWEALEDIFKKYPQVELRIIGAGTDALRWPPFEHVRYSTCPGYSNDEMVDHALDMDIGLFPMFDVENSAVRGVMKALVYMSAEAAVIASPRGQCTSLIQEGVTGYLAETRQEWVDKLSRLIDDPSLRKTITQNALRYTREHYSMPKIFSDLKRILEV